MLRVVKLVIALAILGMAGLAAYAYVGLTPPQPGEMRAPVVLDVG